MKNLIAFFFTALLLFFFAACNDSSSDDNKPDPDPTNYTVDYSLVMEGDYDNLQVVYYESGSLKKEINSPEVPWKKSFDNFVLGDSVYLELNFISKPNQEAFYYISMEVMQGQTGVNGLGDSLRFTPADTALPWRDFVSYKITQ